MTRIGALHHQLLHTARGYRDELEYVLPATPDVIRRAIHEAGHAVAAAAFGDDVPIATIDITDVSESGSVHLRRTAFSLRDRAVMYAAGRVAEQRFLTSALGWSNDLSGSVEDFQRVEALCPTEQERVECQRRAWLLLGEHAVFLRYVAQRLILHRTVFRVGAALTFWVRKYFLRAICSDCPTPYSVPKSFVLEHRMQLHCPNCGRLMNVDSELHPPFATAMVPPWRAKVRRRRSHERNASPLNRQRGSRDELVNCLAEGEGFAIMLLPPEQLLEPRRAPTASLPHAAHLEHDPAR
jgi:hypothetical protein